ncbi:hypothetical protein FQZ97_1234180 [compost metagenome]
MGAAISPATAPATAARPQPTASTLLVLMPDSSADGAFTATARIARPNRVKRKNANTAASSARVTSRTPTSWADR